MTKIYMALSYFREEDVASRNNQIRTTQTKASAKTTRKSTTKKGQSKTDTGKVCQVIKPKTVLDKEDVLRKRVLLRQRKSALCRLKKYGSLIDTTEKNTNKYKVLCEYMNPYLNVCDNPSYTFERMCKERFICIHYLYILICLIVLTWRFCTLVSCIFLMLWWYL